MTLKKGDKGRDATRGRVSSAGLTSPSLVWLLSQIQTMCSLHNCEKKKVHGYFDWRGATSRCPFPVTSSQPPSEASPPPCPDRR